VKRPGSVTAKLLFAFVGCLTVMTLLHVGLTAWLTSRQGQAEAFSRLSQQLIRLQDDLHGARDAVVAVAQEAARDEKNLNDLGIVYGQELALVQQSDVLRERALGLHKTASLNRLHLILISARLSSLAVYLESELSHYVTRDEAGMRLSRGVAPAVIGIARQAGDKTALDNAQHWPERPLPTLVARRLTVPDRLTVTFEFPSAQLMVLRVVAPIEAETRQSFNETIAERLGPATRESLRQADGDGRQARRVIGAFVFSQAFDHAFLRDVAGDTGVLPAVLSADGRRQVGLLGLRAPRSLAASGAETRPLHLETVVIDGVSHYQAMKPWRIEGESALILGAALSGAGTSASVRRTIAIVFGVASVLLAAGVGIGYALISRMVTPIEALTTGAASMKLAAGGAAGEREDDALYGALGRYLERPVAPRSTDEIGALTSAFNAMAERLHVLIGNLRQSHRALEAVSAQRQQAEAEVRGLNATLEQQVRDRTAQLEAANKELESFSYSVSHDLRAPLRSLDGFSRALLEDYDAVLDDEGREHLRRICAASQHMGALIDDILNLARVSRTELRRGPVDLSALARSVVDELRRREPDREIEFVIAPNLTAAADARLLRILLENLLQNASKFTSRRPRARIECGQAVRNGALAYFVRDDGVGFDMAYAHKLFGAFQRLHTDAEFPGTGIGLATVHRIVHRHGGDVWAESELDRGATFYFTLSGRPTTP
jgi:signal transduction histidine kinase